MEDDNNWHCRIPNKEEVIKCKRIRNYEIMRNSFATEITKLAYKNKKIVLLSGDIGNRLFDNFEKVKQK